MPRAIPVGIPSVFLIGEAVMGIIDLFLLENEINTIRAKKNKSAEKKNTKMLLFIDNKKKQ